MSITVRDQTDALAFATASALNQWKREVCQVLASLPHCDITSVDTSTDYRNPTSTPLVVVTTTANTIGKVQAIANDMKRVFNLHCADGVCHLAADATNPVTDADVVVGTTDQTDTDTFLNGIKASFNLHLAQSGVHFTNDITNACSTTDAHDLASSETLVDDLRTKLNAHIAFGFASPSLNLVDP
jgi:hypothetical protein